MTEAFKDEEQRRGSLKNVVPRRVEQQYEIAFKVPPFTITIGRETRDCDYTLRITVRANSEQDAVNSALRTLGRTPDELANTLQSARNVNISDDLGGRIRQAEAASNIRAWVAQSNPNQWYTGRPGASRVSE